jgi:DNA replicative helicase MCM subunit Mcm2 (Cdc46/Mcm family)
MSLNKSTQAVSILLACYPQSKADDAFGKMAAQALANYNDRTLGMLVDPNGGIITTSKFLPSIAELVQWCKDFEYNAVPSKPKYVTFDPVTPPSPESKARIDEILARYHSNFRTKKEPVVTEEELEAIKTKFKDPPKLSEEALRLAKFKNSLPYKDD